MTDDPRPRPPAPFRPLSETLPPGTLLWRCHPSTQSATAPNPTGTPARFRPVRTPQSAVVPTLYAGDSTDTALSEGAFHDLPVKAGPKHLPRASTDRLSLSELATVRKLELVTMHGYGLRRLGVTQGDLIEPGGDAAYRYSALWGQAAYDWDGAADGIVWVSRQFTGGLAYLFFGDRLAGALEPTGAAYPLVAGTGYRLLAEAANKADVVIVE